MSTPTRGPARPVEVELKYRPRDAADGERYLGAEELAGLRPVARLRTTQLEDRYLDTADGALARAGFAARLRVSSEGTIVSVKAMARRPSARGVHRREELEGPADRTTRPRDWPSSDARSLMLELCGDAPLVELVTIRQLRRHRQLRDGDTVVELSLDEVDVVARSRLVDRFSELEIEHIRGDEGRLLAVAAVLDADAGLERSPGSKLEAALAAVRAHVRRHGPLPPLDEDGDADAGRTAAAVRQPRQRIVVPARSVRARAEATIEKHVPKSGPPKQAVGRPPRPSGMAVPGVTGADSIAEAGRKALRFHLAAFAEHEAGARAGDVGKLRDLEAAAQRLVLGWRMHAAGFPKATQRGYGARLDQLAVRVAAARNWAVCADHAARWRGSATPRPQDDLESLRRAWRRHSSDALGLLVRELDTERQQRFVDELRVFAQGGGSSGRPGAPTQPHHVRDTAGSRVLAAWERLRAAEPILHELDPDGAAFLQDASAWFLVALESVATALGSEAPALIERAGDLDAALERWRDADQGAAAARALLAEGDPSARPDATIATQEYIAALGKESVVAGRSVRAAWRAVTATGFRRRLGRALAGL